ncbi:phospholipid/cholesterol/gamma-HCH transport system substrate-binding protein [Aeromicrobium panaciterrae]|uniref:Phospholipid/cholesterol/gamma-HCH transport system substrate-binding protein n=1 Tax=Aeromicrobium panaciterrae TaxID=363861 RepID=A0ABU1UJE0_9ACTN|nr:MCE family protein [Aeromicrobium panaciterrae]MDR7085304.1 phospholipid/cholesterol/gamma-HCH transport system substrate-binding protein [Aeromicrobium panaciterrae]
MLANLIHDTPGERRRLAVSGVAFILTIALMIWLCIALYNKQFTKTTEVTVMAERTGLQLAKFGDVRMHGALVGNIQKIESTGKQAKITLHLRPEAARNIPANVTVQIMPTTLFGRKYVQLVPPEGESVAGAAKLKDGTVIPASRVTTNVELQSIMANLFPLLRSIKPADINSTLYALAHALEGKGEQLGDTFESLDAYLRRVNVKLPTLKTDLSLLADVAKTYDLAAPDLIRLLDNATVTAKTLTAKSDSLNRALGSITGLARVTRVTLSENEQLLIDQVRSGRPLLALLDTYSPELPCLLEGIVLQRENTINVFQNNLIHQTLELGAPQRTAYTAADAAEFGEIGHGPWCLGLPADYKNPATFQPLKDGSDKDNPDGDIK